MNIAINRMAGPPLAALLHELRQRRAGTFPRDSDDERRQRRRNKEHLARKQERLAAVTALASGRFPGGSGGGGAPPLRSSNKLGTDGSTQEERERWAQYALQEQVGMVLHRDLLQLLATGHRLMAAGGSKKPATHRGPAGTGAGVGGSVGGGGGGGRLEHATGTPSTSNTALTPSASSSPSTPSHKVATKLDKLSYTRWPMKCGCVRCVRACVRAYVHARVRERVGE